MNRRHFITTIAAALALRPLPALARAENTALEFLVVGDWGTGGQLQKTVAAGMQQVIRSSGAVQFILSTGDNIYPNGVTSEDDGQWKTKFETPYSGITLPWWAILGNHDHRGSTDAQIRYSSRNPRWNMPGKTWHNEFAVNPVTKLSVIALDTTPLLQKEDGWREQLEWLEQTLAATTSKWKVVAGHHPLRSYGHYGDSLFLVKNVKPLLDTYGVHLYCCGHDHDVQAIKNPSDSFACLVSGGGGGVRASKRGAHTVAMIDTGGFAYVRADAAHMRVQLHNAAGDAVGGLTL